MTSHKQQAAKFIALCERNGGYVKSSYAGTGTIYVTVTGEEGDIKVRFANHGECYCREDISVDPYGCTYAQAIRSTMRMTGIDLSRSLRSLDAAASRRANEAAERDAVRAASYAAAMDVEAARLAFQAEFVARRVASRPADAGDPSKKSLKRYRAEANAAFAAK